MDADVSVHKPLCFALRHVLYNPTGVTLYIKWYTGMKEALRPETPPMKVLVRSFLRTGALLIFRPIPLMNRDPQLLYTLHLAPLL